MRTPAGAAAVTPTDSQWRAIRPTDRHVLIAAGAGTGKTYTVIAKILFLLGVEIRGERVDAPLVLRDIAAITYTNQAAKDLKQDLREALRKAGRTDDAYEVDLARIGTIHSFCSDLIREYALRAGRTPPGAVLEEGVALERATEAARDALVDALEDGSIDGLAELLAAHRTSDVDGWIVQLMRRADLTRRLIAAARVDGWERVLAQLATRALARYEAFLERDGAIDFDRMVLWTRDLLRDDGAIRHALQRRIRVLIVDEFQDVDPVQQEIAYLLAEPAGGRADTTRLVFVGDPKQSIYRFRGADVTVWSGVERDFGEGGLGVVLPLEENRRSVPGILGFVEATVGRTLDAPVSGGALQPFEVPFRPVRPVRTADAPHAVELLLIPPDAEGKRMKVDAARALEADAVAARAVALHREGTPWEHMALLLATWGSADVYRAALERAAVPVYTLRSEGFYDTRVVLDLVLALEVARDPEDDRALIGFLRSPFVGLRDESLAALALAYPPPYWRRLADVALDDEDEGRRLARAREWIDEWIVLRDRVPAAALLASILDRTGYLGHLALRGETGAQALANVRQFVSIARASGDIGVGDLLRVVAERRARKDRVAEARLHGERDPVLTITSVHVAKGLEWPVVFWADLSGGSRIFNDKLVVLRDGIALGQPDTAAKEQPQPWQDARAAYLREEQAESKRLWYVAATRAKDLLVASGIRQGTGVCGPAATMVLAAFPELNAAADGDIVRYGASFLNGDGDTAPGLGSDAGARVTGSTDALGFRALVRVLVNAPPDVAGAGEPVTYATADIGDPSALPPRQLPIVVPAGPPRHSATALLAHARCPRRYWFKYVAGLEEPDIPFMKKQIVSAVARGQIVHDVLERWEAEAELASLLEDAIGRFDEHAPPPETTQGRVYRGELSAEVGRVLEHDAWRVRLARPHVRRELGFLYLHGEDFVAQGSIDLATPDAAGTGLELIDVKTSQCDAAAAERKATEYSPQRDVYATAASSIAGLPVTRFGFLFSKPGVNVEAPIDAAEASDIRARFAARAAGAAGADHPLTTDPAECRWCGFQRMGLCPGIVAPVDGGAREA